MQKIDVRKINVVVVGSGLSSLNFIDTYLKKNKKIDVISPDFNNEINSYSDTNNHLFKFVPSKMENKLKQVKNYFLSNSFIVNKNCQILGTLEFGGLSNYWGLQIDKDIVSDIKHLKKSTVASIKKNFIQLLNKFDLIGSVNFKSNLKYNNNYITSENLEQINKSPYKNYTVAKPILGISKKKNKNKIIKIDELKNNCSKLISTDFLRKRLNHKNIKFHNFSVQKIYKNKKKIILLCKRNNKVVKFIANRVVLGCGTMVTTKLILDFLKIKKETKIKHHPRLISAFVSRRKIKSNMTFTPSLIQIKSKKRNDNYIADIRPGNKLITNAIIDINKLLLPIKYLINLLKDYLIFSNILLDSTHSNLYIKVKSDSDAQIYSKKQKTFMELKKRHFDIFKFLFKNKVIFPIYKTLFPGIGADYHYFGTIPITNDKKKLSVNENCQLKNNKSIYIIDGSVFDFKLNKYPLGVIMANARRIGDNFKK